MSYIQTYTPAKVTIICTRIKHIVQNLPQRNILHVLSQSTYRQIPPVFKSTPTQFQTIIYAATDTTNVGDMSEIELTERQQNILKLIKDSPTMTAKQMSEILSVTQRTIERDIATLRDKKKRIIREGSDKDGKWIIR